jgi:uncharacterized membrane-anchored protein YjiN (DUF445 family)
MAEAELKKRKKLTQMRLESGGILAIFTLAFFISKYYQGRYPAAVIILAISEAAMVGGLADWFAVTALFRHPLGLPIPHTALIPNEKNNIGKNLGSYVQQNFLTAEVLIEKIREFNAAGTISKWMTDTEKVSKMTDQVIKYVPEILDKLSDDDINRFIKSNILIGLDNLDLNKLFAEILKTLTANNRHQEILNEGIKIVNNLMHENEQKMRELFSDRFSWFLQFIKADEYFFNKLLGAISAYLQELNDDKNHRHRKEFNNYMNELIVKLETSDEYKQKVISIKNSISNNEVLINYINNIWSDLKKMIIEDIKKPNSNIKYQIEKTINSIGKNLLNDSAIRNKLNSGIENAAVEVISSNSDKIVRLISDKVESWSAKDFAESLELEVGSDLQYIRINGTLVGALVGAAIYFISHLY